MSSSNYYNNYVRTDLAIETVTPPDEAAAEKNRDIDYYEENKDGITVTTLKIKTEHGAKQTGKPCGTYVTVSIGRIWFASEPEIERTASVLADCINMFTEILSPGAKNILVAGLGNRDITADAVGPICAGSVNVTRHIKDQNAELFANIASSEVSAIVPGVLGQTGIETLALIKGAAKDVKPSLVIAVDSLAALSTDRLATTVQFTDTGISPGSGIGNRRALINRETLGVPVLVIGVPTVVDSSTLVYSALEKAGIEKIDDRLTEILENGRSFFVSLKESDTAVTELARLIARSINKAFGNDFS